MVSEKQSLSSGRKTKNSRANTFIKSIQAERNLIDSGVSTNIYQKDITRKPPRINEVKGNFDTAYIRISLRSVTGLIFRDCEGFILAAYTYQNRFVADATTAEAIEYLQAVSVAEDLGFRNLVVERDSLTVIKKIQTKNEDRSNITAIIQEIKERAHRF